MSKEAFSLLDKGIQEAVWDLGWTDFKPIQVQAIHTICESKDNLLICAPTAGGKTEAAFLPIISQLVASPQLSVQAIYVGPLKALINDQFRRLEELCQKLEIKVHRWHGDVSANQKKAFRDSPSGILLITPESLESNFINFGVHVPRLYRHLSFIVIDELHSFLGNVRGVHLQSLLTRLASATGGSPRLVGLSATLADPQTARSFLAPDAPDTVRVVDDPHSSREVRLGLKAFLKKPHEQGGSVQWLMSISNAADSNVLAILTRRKPLGITPTNSARNTAGPSRTSAVENQSARSRSQASRRVPSGPLDGSTDSYSHQ